MNTHIPHNLALSFQMLSNKCVPPKEYRNGIKVICQHQQQAFSECGGRFFANKMTDGALKLWIQPSAQHFRKKTFLESHQHFLFHKQCHKTFLILNPTMWKSYFHVKFTAAALTYGSMINMEKKGRDQVMGNSWGKNISTGATWFPFRKHSNETLGCHKSHRIKSAILEWFKLN